ncbi:MAG: hypothetical protein EB829_03100 [Nitrosopumilus sp. H8]|nr:MAG: hypothetical protein EB829_03100 [Nitrosopumilus sp. H8]
MADSIIDDVKTLLEGDYGDDRILKQIHRACENGEIISNYERNYVRDLTEKHMGRRKAEPVPEAPHIPDVVIPVSRPQALRLQAHRPRVKRRKPSSKMILLIVVALAVIIPAAAFFGSYEPGVAPAPTGPYVKTEFSSYGANELIRIDGISGGSGQIAVSITDGDGKTVWSDDVDIKDDRSYSAVTATAEIRASPGTYTVSADDGTTRESATFSFVQ